VRGVACEPAAEGVRDVARAARRRVDRDRDDRPPDHDAAGQQRPAQRHASAKDEHRVGGRGTSRGRRRPLPSCSSRRSRARSARRAGPRRAPARAASSRPGSRRPGSDGRRRDAGRSSRARSSRAGARGSAARSAIPSAEADRERRAPREPEPDRGGPVQDRGPARRRSSARDAEERQEAGDDPDGDVRAGAGAVRVLEPCPRPRRRASGLGSGLTEGSPRGVSPTRAPGCACWGRRGCRPRPAARSAGGRGPRARSPPLRSR
jgi:hypothetical protein